MRQWMRLVLVVLMLGAFVAQTTVASAEFLTTDVIAMSEPCCPADCPTTPDCDPVCVAVMQCQAAIPFLILPESRGADTFARSLAAFALSITQVPETVPQQGLQRPPKV